jgi:uncharacterized protein (DUF885 family)
MSRSKFLVSVLLLASVAGFAHAADDRAKQLNTLYTEYWEENLKLNPIMGTFTGDPRYNAELPNFLTKEYEDRQHAFVQKYLDKARAIGSAGLTGQDALSYDIFTLARESELEEFKFPDRLLPVDQFYNVAAFFAQLGSGTNAQPFVTVKDYDDWLKRASNAPAIFDQAIVNMREGVKAGITQPRVLMEKVLPQLEDLTSEDPEKSIFWGPIQKLPKDFSAADRDRLTAAYRALITTQLNPAYVRLRDYIKNEYLPKCRDTVGMNALPNGVAWYNQKVRDNTTKSLTSAQIHQIGLDEVARIQDGMRGVAKELGYDKPVKSLTELKAFFDWMKARPENYFGSREELLAAYQKFHSDVDPLLPKYFNLRPKTNYEVRLVEPFREASASSGSYQGASLDGKRPGIFYVNAYDLKARPKWALEALSLHEAAPGHHFQISLQQELGDLPMFRRVGGNDTAYVEGWGLYSEYLGYEMGIYKNPVARFGALDAELWRAIRLVTDTGLHYKGWTRQQTLDYMFANSPAEQTRAVSEAERFMAIPGQALAYKIGQLKIVELRKKAEKALGPKFQLAAFHDEVLRDGSVPLDVLEKKIDRWIAANQ